MKSATPPTLDEEKLVYFGPQTKKLFTKRPQKIMTAKNRPQPGRGSLQKF